MRIGNYIYAMIQKGKNRKGDERKDARKAIQQRRGKKRK